MTSNHTKDKLCQSMSLDTVQDTAAKLDALLPNVRSREFGRYGINYTVIEWGSKSDALSGGKVKPAKEFNTKK